MQTPLRIVVALLALVVAASAAACSGPGAMAAIKGAQEFGRLMAFIHFPVCLLLLWRYLVVKTGPGHPVVVMALMAVHPFFWVSATSGDCGGSLRSSSVILLGVVGALLIVQLGYRRRRPAGPPPVSPYPRG
ncbi:MAG: hypothetical protein WD716_04865 [Fimbriimonadaceae bacterium]